MSYWAFGMCVVAALLCGYSASLQYRRDRRRKDYMARRIRRIQKGHSHG